MNLVAGLTGRLEAFVHPSVRADAVERTRHLLFIASRLVFAVIICASVPPYLAIQGTPAFGDAVFFACALAPLASVWVAMRTGNLLRAHVSSLIGLLGMATTLGLASPGFSAVAMLWLIVAPLDAVLAFSLPLVVAAIASALAAILGVGLAQFAGIGAADGSISAFASSIAIALAIVHAGAAVAAAVYMHQLRLHRATLGTARYRTLTDVLGDLVLRFDRTGSLLHIGGDCEALTGLNPAELRGRGLFERIHVGDRPAFLKAVADAIENPRLYNANVRLRVGGALAESSGGGQMPVFRWYELRAHKVRTDGDFRRGRDASVVAILRDISAAKRHETELEAARNEAEKANQWKDRFLANVSHELRTPLNAIIGFAEILGTPELSPAAAEKRYEYARIIQESGQHLLAVVNSILDISKIEAGSFDLLPEPFEVQPLIDQCCDMLSLKAQASGVTIVRDYSGTLEELVADKRAFKQVAINLISNAVKFTRDNGEVKVSVHPEGNSMIFTVADTGIGIRSLDLARLGDPFFQAKATYDRPYEGTGLGLSVVRGLVGLHGGSIRIESAPDEGTRVTVRFPMDCRAIARDNKTSAKIEAIPLNKGRAGADTFSGHSQMVKKIA